MPNHGVEGALVRDACSQENTYAQIINHYKLFARFRECLVVLLNKLKASPGVETFNGESLFSMKQL